MVMYDDLADLMASGVPILGGGEYQHAERKAFEASGWLCGDGSPGKRLAEAILAQQSVHGIDVLMGPPRWIFARLDNGLSNGESYDTAYDAANACRNVMAHVIIMQVPPKEISAIVADRLLYAKRTAIENGWNDPRDIILNQKARRLQ